MSNIVNPESRDPLAQALGRPSPSLRGARLPSSVNAPSPPPATPAPTAEDEEVPATGVEQAAAAAETQAILAEGQAPFSSEVAPDYILPSANEAPSQTPGIRPLRLRPMTYENPTTVQINLEDDATALDRIRNEALSEEISDDIVYSESVRDRIAESAVYARGTDNYVPVINTYDFIAEGIDDQIERRRNAFDAATRPVGVRPDQGMLGVGRNVLQGRPFSRISGQVIEDTFSRYAEDGEYQTRLGRFIRNRLPQGLQRGALNLTAGARGAEYLGQVVGDIRDTERELLETNPEYRTLGRRALDEVSRFITRPAVLGMGSANEFRPSTYVPPLLTALAEESPAFRQLMTELGPTLDERGALRTNPLTGDFGEFGNAGALSAGLYLLNIPGGAFTGAIYEAAGSVRDVLGRVNPSWSRENLTYTPTPFSPLAGVDTGFTQNYTPDRYLSTIGNPALDWLPRSGQIALGFALDVAADPDGLITRPIRNAVRASRSAGGLASVADALDSFNTAQVDLPSPRYAAALQQTYVRPTAEGVRSAATTAVLPTVNVVEAVPVIVAARPVTRRAAARGGSIITVEDLLNRVEYVTRQLEDTAAAVRDVPGMSIDEGVDAVVTSTRNYELTLQSAVREANLLSTSLTKQDFQSFASSILTRMRSQGVNISDTGAIQLRSSNATLDALVVPIRAEASAPLYRNYSDVLDIYRQNPTALPPEAYQLVRRDNTAIVNLAKTWEVLPANVTASNARITQLRTTNPEFAHVWGSPIDPNIGAPLRRIVEIPQSGLMDTPEVSRMVGSQPPVTVDVTTAPVNQLPPPPDIEQTLRRIQSNYAREVDRFASTTVSTSAANRAMQRMTQLRQEGAALIADYPEVAARILADAQPTPVRYPGVLESATNAARADMGMRYQHSVLDDLQRQLGIVNRRVQEQQTLLDELPPLERRFLDSEIDTRRMHGEEVPISTINTPSSLSNETVYPAARRQLFENDALLPQNTGIDNDVRTIISQGELSTIPEDEALELLRSSVELETFNAIDVDTNEVLSASELTLDSLLEFNLDDYMMQLTINELPRAARFNDNGDLVINASSVQNTTRVSTEDEAFDTLANSVINQLDTIRGEEWAATFEQFRSLPEMQALSRDQQDAFILKLQSIDAVELSTLQDVADKSPEQLAAGIPQNIGGAWYYIEIPDSRVVDTASAELVLPRAQVFEAYENAQRNGISYYDLNTQQLVIEPMPKGARYIGGGAYGQTYLMPDGTLSKRGSITDNEVRLQRKAAAQGIAPEVISEHLDSMAAREFTMQFLDGYQELNRFRDDATMLLPVTTPGGRVLTPDDLYAVEMEVYKTIDRLHQAGVVHNDIHSANIMVNPETLDVRIIDFGLATEDAASANYNSMTDYGYVASEFGRDVLYHGTHHTSRVSDANVFSLSNEFGPASYLTSELKRAEAFAKAYPAQDVVTTSRRIPRREQIGNVQAVVTENLGQYGPAKTYAPRIQEAFLEELRSRGDTRLARNFKAWIRNNDDPAHWWHYLRERFTDDNMTELAKMQIGIRDRMIEKGVRAFEGVTKGDYVIIDPELIGHRSIPHHVEGTGTVAEALAYRNAVDSALLDNLSNNTTKAIDAHNKLNMDTYVQNQLAAAATEQQRETLEALRAMNEMRNAHQATFINRRSVARRERLAELEVETNRVVSMELKSLNDVCL